MSDIRLPLAAGAATVDVLLPGESAGSDRLDDALHWTAVYAELTGFLLEIEDGLPAPDVTLARYLRRLDFWRDRLTELRGAAVTAHDGG